MHRTLHRSVSFLVFLCCIFPAAGFAPAERIQPPEGFVALFNGEDLSGWKGLVANPIVRAKATQESLDKAQAAADEKMRANWRAEDGILVFDGKGDSLCTAQDYGDFELLVDWKIEANGDSGIYLRGSPQVQIWDPAVHPEGSGGLYNNQKNPSQPMICADRPMGEWNTFRILMRDEKVTVFLNGFLVVYDTVMENYWERDRPIYRTGQIELQSHHTPLYFRNIFLREIPAHEPEWKPLFNGEDLTGWIPLGDPDSWKAEAGLLFTTGKGGDWLCTEREFSDFDLKLECKIPEGGNSGVFIRAPREGNPAYEGMEIQVLDDYAPQYAELKPWQYMGSLYDLVPAEPRVSKKAGEWQCMEITCKGRRVRVTLNEHVVVDANLDDHMDRADSHPGLKRVRGHIGLQNHGSRLDYRSLLIREYP